MNNKRKWAAICGMVLSASEVIRPESIPFVIKPDAKTRLESYIDGSEIFKGPCCSRCANRFGGSNHRYCEAHCNDEKCSRFKLEK